MVLDAQVETLRRDGWVRLDGLADAWLDAAEAAVRSLLTSTPTGRDSFEGRRTQRVYALLGKSRAFDPLVAHPAITSLCQAVLGEGFRVSSATAIAIGPGERAQTLHYDAQVYPLPRPEPEVVVNTMWALTPFTEANGATRLVEGSHRWGPERRPPRGERTIAAVMPRGSVIAYLGSLWHGGGANESSEVRVGANLEYAAGWVRQQENQYLVVPPDRVAGVPEPVLRVLGYSIAPPFLGYVDARDPLRHLEQQNRLRPNQ
ncbi:MAG: phytanoyl-CoA dioxygenase family protein [Acidimicrobiales bacterium]